MNQERCEYCGQRRGLYQDEIAKFERQAEEDRAAIRIMSALIKATIDSGVPGVRSWQAVLDIHAAAIARATQEPAK